MIRVICLSATLACVAAPLVAEVRFGNNVRIGGNDVSNQTFTKKKRGKFIIHDETPENEGCRLEKNRDGSKTKVCNYKKKN